MSVRNLADDQRAAARAVCVASGVIDPVLLDACTLDVAVTDDPAFAAGAVAAPAPAVPYALYVNLAAGRPVTVAGPSQGGSPEVVTDGVYAPEGTVWNDGQYAVVIPGGTSLTIDLGAVFSIHEVVSESYGCGSGKSHRTCSRAVTRYRSESRSRTVTRMVPVIDAQCAGEQTVLASNRAVYLVELLLQAPGVCRLSCVRLLPASDGSSFTRVPCPLPVSKH